jgi:hypothetical protein
MKAFWLMPHKEVYTHTSIRWEYVIKIYEYNWFCAHKMKQDYAQGIWKFSLYKINEQCLYLSPSKTKLWFAI